MFLRYALCAMIDECVLHSYSFCYVLNLFELVTNAFNVVGVVNGDGELAVEYAVVRVECDALHGKVCQLVQHIGYGIKYSL